jgi:membrane protein DedA with SNARE-associated domain
MKNFLLVYVIGFLLVLTFLKLFGKKIGLNHQEDHDYSNSLMWPMTVPLFLIVGFVKVLFMIDDWRMTKRKNKSK